MATTDAYELVGGLILFVIIAFGTVGNILSFITWKYGKRCSTQQCSIFFTALAVSDTLVLWLYAGYFAIEFVFGFNVSDINLISCKFFHTVGHFTNLVSAWIVVFLTVQRAIAVFWPLQTSRRIYKRHSVIIILIIAFVSLLLNLPWTFGKTLLPINQKYQRNWYGMTFQIGDTLLNAHNATEYGSNGTQTRNVSAKDERLTCQSDPSSFYFKNETLWHKWIIDFVLLYTGPLVIITTCNVLILTTVCRRHNKLKTDDSSSHVKTGTQAMTARVVAISVVQIVSVGPYSVAVLFPEFVQNINKVGYVTCLVIIFVAIWYLNHAVNFVLYSLFGEVFRHDCYALICKRDTNGEHGTKLSSNLNNSVATVTSTIGD